MCHTLYIFNVDYCQHMSVQYMINAYYDCSCECQITKNVYITIKLNSIKEQLNVSNATVI